MGADLESDEAIELIKQGTEMIHRLNDLLAKAGPKTRFLPTPVTPQKPHVLESTQGP